MEANVLHTSGTGKIHVDPRYAQPGMIKAALYNFDVDGDQLKPEHRIFLQTKIAPLLQGDNGHIWMQGSASKSGSNAHNMGLSRRRVANAAQFLRSLGILDRQMQLDAVGEELAQSHALEDANDRAVGLLVLPVAKESPSPPKNIPPPPRVTTEFKIRLLGALSGSAGPFQIENCFFQIADKKNNLTSFYVFSSGGAGKGLIKGLNLSATMKGPWNDFTTNSPIRVSQFGGATRFTTAGAGNWTSNHLNMMGLPRSVSTVPPVLHITTGFTMGIGASTSVGDMILNPREEMIYNGD
jgi:hypothetical protein